MSNVDKAITSRQGAIFFQPDGPNTAMKYVDCRTLGDLSINHGSRELIQCFDTYGNYVTKGSTKGAPEMISTSMEIMLKRKPDWAERLSPTNGYSCQFPIYVLQRTCGRADDADNFVRMLRLNRADLTSENYSQIVSRNEDQESMLNVDLEAEPPADLFHELMGRRLTTTEANHITDIWFNRDTQCDPDCGTTYNPGDYGFAVCHSTAAATPNVLFTFNGGTTWTAMATDPGVADDDLAACTAFAIGNGRMRYMVAKLQAAASQGQIFYVDADVGVLPTGAWTAVNIGGATANHNAPKGGCLFSLDKEHIWLCTNVGYIYFSSDGGVTWTAQESGTIHSAAYNFIHFADDQYGMAVGAADVVAVTTNGGDSWAAATATGAGVALNSCQQLDNNRLWAGTANGRLYYSLNRGVTWTRRTGFTIDGTGSIRSMSWLDEYTGFIVHDNATPAGAARMTVNGGYTWKDITTITAPANSGLNSIFAVNNNLAFLCGQTNAATGFLGKVSLLFDAFD